MKVWIYPTWSNAHCFHSREIRTNAIAAICTSGLVGLELTIASVDQEIFFDFINIKNVTRCRDSRAAKEGRMIPENSQE